MASTFIATAEYSSNSSNSGLVNKPAGTVNNDIMFALVMHYSDFATTIPSGWTSIAQTTLAGGQRFELFYKVAASEGASYTWATTNVLRMRIIIATYRGGFNISNPIDQVSNTPYTAGNVNVRAASMTTSAANETVITWAMIIRSLTSSYTPPTALGGMTEDYDSWDTGPDVANAISSGVAVSAGATGDIDTVSSVSVSGVKHAFAVALNPLGGVTTVTPTKSLQYAVKAPVSVTKGLIYDIKIPLSVTKALKYTIKAPVAPTKSLKYTVKIPLSVTKGLQYVMVGASINVTKGLQYTIKAPVSLTKSVRYAIKTVPTAATKGLIYAIKRPATLTKGLQYIVKSPLAITKTVQYAVKKSLTVTKSLAYVVKVQTSIPKTLRYVVKAQASVTKSLRYMVVAPSSQVVITKSMQYVVIVVKTNPFHPKGQIFTPKPIVIFTQF